jgi:hypothetical protein
MPTPRLGRPPRAKKPASDADRIQIRVTAAERRTFEAAAKREGISLSEWLRAAAELAIARGSTR